MVERLRERRGNVRLTLMLALTFSTGVVDAVGYLGFDKVFAGNMTGNVVILGMALAGADGLPWVGPAVALATFMLGAAVSGRTLRRVERGWTGRSTWLFGATGLILAALAVTLWVTGGVPPAPWELLLTAFLAAAMGVQAGAARHLGVKDVTTVVVTSTITGLAADSRLAGGKGQPWARRAAAVLLIAAGALAGALLLLLHVAAGLALAAVVTLVVAGCGHAVAHEEHGENGRGDPH